MKQVSLGPWQSQGHWLEEMGVMCCCMHFDTLEGVEAGAERNMAIHSWIHC